MCISLKRLLNTKCVNNNYIKNRLLHNNRANEKNEEKVFSTKIKFNEKYNMYTLKKYKGFGFGIEYLQYGINDRKIYKWISKTFMIITVRNDKMNKNYDIKNEDHDKIIENDNNKLCVKYDIKNENNKNEKMKILDILLIIANYVLICYVIMYQIMRG